ncbi:MAG: hypothetical protein HY912_05985 [Desulfomonile tiedjei]|uniref:Uncharacterized protein n=1 Tax=Desulfomonile tiedjei TaxID=2358 RepID=A0A9D6Z2X8_9BACT|nr:hypothetical protein [Desulfomonile tiedjei]
MADFRRFVKEFSFYFIISISVVFSLTALAGRAATNLSPGTAKFLQSWMKQGPENRFDDWMDGIVLANILYKNIDPRHSLWTYFLPSSAPSAGFELLGHVLSPDNRGALAETIRDRKGELLHRYWTGHIALTTLALYVYTDPAVASKLSLSCVLFSMLAFVFAWSKRSGSAGAMGMAAMLLGSGAVYMESFHTHSWGLALAFGTAAYTAKRLAAGESYVPAAVTGAVFANWLGYDYVFSTIAFSLPLFLHTENGKLQIEDLGGPFKFTLVFLAVTALMMILRIPVAYLFENCPPSEFLSQLTERFAYRLHGEHLPQEIAPGAEISRRAAILSALPAVNGYLFSLGGRFIPLIQSVASYLAYQALPVAVLMGVLVFKNSDSQLRALRPVLVVFFSVILFHLVLIVLVNHACVHPWMHARYMVFSLVLSWGAAVSALTPSDLLSRLFSKGPQ